MKKNFLLIVLLITCVNYLKAQTLPGEWSYDSVKKFYRNYVYQLNDTSIDGELQKYHRFEATMDYKINKNANISDYVNVVKEYNANLLSRSNNSNGINISSLNSDWFCRGPMQTIESAIGRVSALWVNPQPPYNIIIGMATIIWLIIYGGVIIAAKIRTKTKACFLYFFKKSGVTNPIFVKKNIIIGSSKINPEAKTEERTNEM